MSAGRVRVVGLGPGPADWRTPEADAALARASDVLGYGPYLDRLSLARLAARVTPATIVRRSRGLATRSPSPPRAPTWRWSRVAILGFSRWRRP